MTSNSGLSLNLGGSSARSFKLHPVVVFNVLDHYKRRNDGQERVIGTLLGIRDGNKVSITNCFPVPHIEKEDTVVVDMDYHKNMLSLHERVNEDEEVLGWYSTGRDLSLNSTLIHNVYRKQVEDDAIVLTVDTDLTDARLAVKAYTQTNLVVDKKPLVARFEPVNLTLQAHEAEKIGVDALINSVPDSEELDAPATILSDYDNLEGSMLQLQHMLETARDYVQAVVDGKQKGDSTVGREIAAALAAIPNLSPENFAEIFNNNMQDLLTVMYLANLTRTQLAVADKINGIL